MNITINNKTVTTAATNLRELADEMTLPASGVAIAVDCRMVPRAEWAETQLREGADLMIIRAVCGG
jgi:sulfur carrier protein